MRSKMRRASSIAVVMTERPGAVSTRSAAARAASVAPLTAMPMSACFSAGASFTPSPVMPTIWPALCSALTILNLCSGNTRANPSAATMRESCPSAPSSSKDEFGDDDVLAEVEFAGDLPRDRFVIAGDHLDVHAHRSGRGDRLGAVIARRIEQRQQSKKAPLARCDPCAPRPASENPWPRPIDRVRRSPFVRPRLDRKGR